MGRAFARLVRQVEGRGSVRQRRIRYSDRMRALEIALLETMAYLCVHIANDGDSPADVGLTAAYHELKQHLEETVV